MFLPLRVLDDTIEASQTAGYVNKTKLLQAMKDVLKRFEREQQVAPLSPVSYIYPRNEISLLFCSAPCFFSLVLSLALFRHASF